MSQAFLSSRCVKILICSSSDRLDKELMIAHMQVAQQSIQYIHSLPTLCSPTVEEGSGKLL